jgi:hypothetical protein
MIIRPIPVRNSVMGTVNSDLTAARMVYHNVVLLCWLMRWLPRIANMLDERVVLCICEWSRNRIVTHTHSLYGFQQKRMDIEFPMMALPSHIGLKTQFSRILHATEISRRAGANTTISL